MLLPRHEKEQLKEKWEEEFQAQEAQLASRPPLTSSHRQHRPGWTARMRQRRIDKMKARAERRYFRARGYRQYITRRGELVWLKAEEVEIRRKLRREKRKAHGAHMDWLDRIEPYLPYDVYRFLYTNLSTRARGRGSMMLLYLFIGCLAVAAGMVLVR